VPGQTGLDVKLLAAVKLGGVRDAGGGLDHGRSWSSDTGGSAVGVGSSCRREAEPLAEIEG
jgi:hypothetical protein